MSSTTRAELLKALHAASLNQTSFDAISQALGYDYQPRVVTPQAPDANAKMFQQDKDDNEPSEYPETIKPQARYWYIDKVEHIKDASNQLISNELASENGQQQKPDEVIAKREAIPESAQNMPYRYIWSYGQWQNCWDKVLPLNKPGKYVDIVKAVAQISQAQPIASLAMKPAKSFTGRLSIMMERGLDIYPVWSDFDRGWRSLVRLFGASQLEAYWIDQGVKNPWLCLTNYQRVRQPIVESKQTIIIMGAFSALKTGKLGDDWQALLEHYQEQGHKLVLISCVPLTLPASLTKNVSVYPLDNNPCGNQERLLSALALAWSPRIKQIRELRLAISEQHSSCSLADELLAFQSNELENLGDDQRRVKKGCLLARLQTLSADNALYSIAAEVVQSWQCHLGLIQREIEALQGQLNKNPDPEHFPRLLGLAKCPDNATEALNTKNKAYLRAIQPHLQLLNQSNPDVAWQSLINQAKKNGLKMDTSNTAKDAFYLHQIGQRLILNGQAAYPLYTFKTKPVYADNWQPVKKIIRTEGFRQTLQDSTTIVTVASTTKPQWAERIWHNQKGLHAAHQDGTEFLLKPANQKNQSAQWQGVYKAWNWADSYGIDEYGLWANLSLSKSVSMKMRWVVAGDFLMGSPEDEAGRYDDEVQHKVTLTQGYWLAETSVTQAQWQVVMGDNPSYSGSKDNDHPVNNVSWDDCQTFIQLLKEQMPNFTPQLPSEAQWEYACRATTQTAYWWGDEFDKNKANNASSIMAESHLPQNPFGLRSMSGNIYEWCQDSLSDYEEQAVTDPINDATDSERVLRGGSWFNFARDLRSASRLAGAPDDRDRSIGFRFAGGFDPQTSKSHCSLTADRRAIAKPVRRQSTMADKRKRGFSGKDKES